MSLLFVCTGKLGFACQSFLSWNGWQPTIWPEIIFPIFVFSTAKTCPWVVTVTVIVSATIASCIFQFFAPGTIWVIESENIPSDVCVE